MVNLTFRPYQLAAFENHTNGLEVWLWGRQTGKSFTLAAWAVARLIRYPGRLVTILSNSRANGMELNLKCAEIFRLWVGRSPRVSQSAPTPIASSSVPSASSALNSFSSFETLNHETRLTINGKTGRIKVLPANPRTARGFSGDLILDEFAFHENSVAIWEAVEPILAANPDYLCRIASTPNGRHNMFYRLATDPQIPLRKVTRSEAWRQDLRIYHPITRAEITPDDARSLALDQRAYDQNYECVFENETMALLSADLIAAAEREKIGVICEQDWSPAALSLLCNSTPALTPRSLTPVGTCSTASDTGSSSASSAAFQNNPSSIIHHPSVRPSTSVPNSDLGSPSDFAPRISNLFIGVDVGRTSDLTVITVLEKQHRSLLVRAILRLRHMRLPDQQQRLAPICRLPHFRAAHIDMTGLGLGLCEYTQKQFGPRIHGINFASSLPLPATAAFLRSLSPRDSQLSAPGVRAPELLAIQLLQAYEDRCIQQPIDPQLRDDLRKPERVTTASGRVSIAATRDEAGHADHFWSLALAVNAALSGPDSYLHVVPRNWVPAQPLSSRRALQLRRVPRRRLI